MNKPKYVVIHRADPNNVGDMAANPLQYFLKPDDYVVIDIATLGQKPYPDDIPIIVGGGGLINNEHFGENLQYALQNPDRLQLDNLWLHNWELSNPKYKDLHVDFYHKFKDLLRKTQDQIHSSKTRKAIWGAGHNVQKIEKIDFEKMKYPRFLKEYDAVGIRDYQPDQAFDYVPCASCMHQGLRKKYEIKNDIVIIEHKKQNLKAGEFGSRPIPRFINSGNNMEQMLELIGTANIVISNSYHGIYWATLMGKRVLCVGAWSSKFMLYKHKPVYIKSVSEDLDEHIDKATVHEDALEEAVQANQKFWAKVQALR